MSKNRVVLNMPLWNKCRLKGRDDLVHVDFQSIISQYLGDDFINNSIEAYRSKLVSCVRSTEFWNQSNEGVVLDPLQNVVFKEQLDALQNILSNNIPILLKEKGCKSIWSRGLYRTKTGQGIQNFLFSRNGA